MTALGFLLVGALVAGLEWAARRSDSGVPTLDELRQHGMAHRASQVTILLLWWWTGWHFLAR